MNIRKIKEQVKSKLTVDRFAHTLRVVDTAKELAEIHRIPNEKVELASLLHDYAKCDTKEDLKGAIKTYNLPDSLLDYHEEVWHGPVGAERLKYELNINDEEVYNAVYFHTTGRHAMSMLELVIFIADYIEPGRNFSGIEEVRKLAKTDLKKATHKALQNSMIFILNRGNEIHPDTLYAYNDLTKYIRSVN